MSKKNETKYSNAGKGDKSRISDKKKYDRNYEKIFGVDLGRVNGDGSQLGCPIVGMMVMVLNGYTRLRITSYTREP